MTRAKLLLKWHNRRCKPKSPSYASENEESMDDDKRRL